MGFFRFFSKMECSRGVFSRECRLDGTLTLNREALDFSDGMEYVETDRRLLRFLIDLRMLQSLHPELFA